MSRLALYLLGPPRIERDGVPVSVDTRKAIAILAYIALTGEGHRRASLVNLLWPEYDRTHGRAALRRTLYALRKALAGDWLCVDRENISLDPSADVWVDVDQFRQHLAGCETHGHSATQVCPACAVSLAEAVKVYRDDFLAGFGLRDSYNFDDWQFFQTDALRGELAAALEKLVYWHCTQREFGPALAHAKRWLALDPLDENIHNQLMQVYAWSGQRSAALGQYEECLRILRDQLGVLPGEATTELYRAIKEGHGPPAPSASQVWPARDRANRPVSAPFFLEKEDRVEKTVFVARERELTQLNEFLDMALTGQGMAVFVTGDAGMGKTALLQEFARHAQATNSDLVVAWGHGNAHTGIGDPYLPFREILGLLTGDIEARWAAGTMTGEEARRLWHLLPFAVQGLVDYGPDLIDLLVPGAHLVRRAAAVAQSPADREWLSQLKELVARKVTIPGNPNVQQSALFEQYTQVLRSLANQKPLILALDDLQWIDSGSANLLFHLGRRISGSRILIVGAYRAADVALGRPAAHPLAALAWGESEAKHEGEWQRHPLEPIVNEFKRTFGDIEVDLHQAEGWQFVNDLLDSEPNLLDGAFRETLYQHTAGSPLFTVELLRDMQERGDLVQNEKGRWVKEAQLEWQMLPARIEAVIAERIGCLPTKLKDALTVASVEGETFTAEVVARVAGTDAGETVRCLSDTLAKRFCLVRAQGVLQLGGQCLSRYRFQHILFQKHLYNNLDPVKRVHLHRAVGTALETLYGESALDVEAAVPQLARHFQEAGTIEKAVEYLQQAGKRARRLYANAEAIEYFRRALALLEDAEPDTTSGDWRQEMTVRIRESLGDVLEWIGEHDNARISYQEALAHVPAGDLVRQAHLYRKTGNIWRMQSQYDKAIRAYDLAHTVLGQKPIESATEWWQEWIQIQLERMWMYYWLGQWREMSKVAKIRSAVEEHGAPTQCVSYFLALASMNSRRDRYVVSEETLAFCQIALAISQESGELDEIAWARFVLGFNQLWYGDLDKSEQQIRAALVLAEQTGDAVHQARCLTYLAIIHRRRVQPQRTLDCAARSLAAATAAQMAEYIGMARANLAWVAWREGDPAQAEVDGQAALELWQQMPAGHSSCAFQWTALWPLIDIACAQNRISEACEFACALLDPTQQRLPEPLVTALEQATGARETTDLETAHTYLERALELARTLSYL